MKILKPKYIIYGKNLKILKDHAILFDKNIKAVAKSKDIEKNHKDIKPIELKDSVVAPAFVNTHTHIEFSANQSQLTYGDFILWLGSIVKNSNSLLQKCTDKVMKRAILQILKSGTATIGAISSFGKDTQVLSKSPLRVIHFNEILGSNPNMIEQNFKAFLERFKTSDKFKSERFTPAISIHSPYSIHKDLAKMAISFAKEKNLIVSTHFLESYHEKEWLEKADGKFKEHLKKFIPNPKPNYNPSEFFNEFKELKTLFTHCVYADNFNDFKPHHSVTHCPTSNRLLGKRALNLKQVIRSKANLNIATDGLSSNLSLNMFDEIRNAIFTHTDIELTKLCKILFRAATLGGAEALGINSGVIQEGKLADLMVIKSIKCEESELLKQLLLHTKNVKQLYIGGEICNF